MSSEILISRKEAKAAGLKFYFTGKLCKWGHVADRVTVSGNCVECHKEWHEDNAEHRKQYGKKWRDEHRAARSAYQRNREATKLQATPAWAELDLILRVYEKRDELNNQWGTDYEVDHIIPLQSNTVCGLHVWANLQLLEKTDNVSKKNRYQYDW